MSSIGKKRSLTLMGKKRGMTQLFDEKGNVIVCTVIEAEPNVVTQLKTKETDGYNAVQLGFETVQGKTLHTIEARAGKPRMGLFSKTSITPRRYLAETRVENLDGLEVGQEITVDIFSDIKFVDATATSKGKGYQGVMKRHHFAGMPATHGTGPVHRHAGSTGMRSTPGRCLPGGKKAGQMGNEQVTVQNLLVVKVVAEDNLIVVKGQVPGPRGGLVYLSEATKKPTVKKIQK